MGSQNQGAQKNNKQAKDNEQNYLSQHPKFLQAKIVQNTDKNPYFQVAQSIANINVYKMWQKRLHQIKNKIGPNSLYLPVECQYQQQGFCGSSGILKFKFQHFPYLLEQQISNRQTQLMKFQDKQIWFLLYILCQTAASLHKLGTIVGDIRSKNIFINKNGDIALLSMFSFPQQLTNYQKSYFQKEVTYLPPQAINGIQVGKQSPQYDQTIGQSFSVGLTILDAIFLTDHSGLYDNMLKFNVIAYQQILKALKKSSLNQKLKSILLLMLNSDPQKRLSCQQICQYLSPYQRQIFQLQEFQISDEFPIKQQQKIQQSPQKSKQSISLGSKRKSLCKMNSAYKSKQKLRFDNNEINSSSTKQIKESQDNSPNKFTQQINQKSLEKQPHSLQLSANNINQSSANYIKNESVKKVQNTENETLNSKQINVKDFKLQHNNFFNKYSNPKLVQIQPKYCHSAISNESPNYTDKVRNTYVNSSQVFETGSTNRNFSHISKPTYPAKLSQQTSLYKQQTPQFNKVEERRQISNLLYNTGGRLFQIGRISSSISVPSQTMNSQGFKKIQSSFNQYEVSSQPISNLGYKNYTTTDLGINQNKYEWSGNINGSKNTSSNYTYSGASVTQLNNPISSGSNYGDLLKNIDKQLQQSRKMFPDSYK